MAVNLLCSDPTYNPAAEAFKNFDQDQSSNMLGSLHLDTDDEPRRGASRANSVRFDESALNGPFGHGSRSSTEYLPVRTGSGFGSHPMTERSSSHKSDGKQSSTGHSAPASSVGASEPRQLSALVPPFVPMTQPPAGLFILGPVPSIIRCWLNTQFSNDTLLYAAVCTGSYKSAINMSLINRLGYQNRLTTNKEDQIVIQLPVHLPEATIQQSSSRSDSPVPQLPRITTDFTVQNVHCDSTAIQIFLGCDILRARNADIHFSLDRMTLFDDERNKLSVPLVRPEDARLFQNLQTGIATKPISYPEDDKVAESTSSIDSVNGTARRVESNVEQKAGNLGANLKDSKMESSTNIAPTAAKLSPSNVGEVRRAPADPIADPVTSSSRANKDWKDSDALGNGSTPDTPTRSESSTVWGSWRRDSIQGTRPENQSSSPVTSSGYQRAGRGRGMKVLKPARLNTSRSASAQQQQLSGFDAAPSRSKGDQSGKHENEKTENNEDRSPPVGHRSFSGDAKTPLHSLTNKPRSANPVGGASAFGWLNASQGKPSSTTIE